MFRKESNVRFNKKHKKAREILLYKKRVSSPQSVFPASTV